MLQIVYISSSTARGVDLTSSILEVFSHNNRRDRVTGLLFADGTRFLQVLEGPGSGGRGDIRTHQARSAPSRDRRPVAPRDRRAEFRDVGHGGANARRGGRRLRHPGREAPRHRLAGHPRHVRGHGRAAPRRLNPIAS
ncbi:BLUF domain-containing protein [Sphingomonas sp. MMS24-JH45]